MPSVKNGWSTSSSISPGLRIGAGVAVALLHVGVAAALFVNDDVKLELPQDAPIMVSVVEAPVPQMAKAEPTPEQPQPPVEEPPPPPPQEETPPPDTKPDPTPDVKPEPEPDPEPVIEKPPEPAPKPKPKPKPKPQPKPQPKKVEPPPKPVETPPPPATPPSGTPQGESKPQAPTQGPPPDQPELVSNVAYDGRGPRPVYPESSRRNREEGRVMVLVVINTDGTIEKATVVQSSGFPRLDQAALDALRRVHFKPYTRNGVAYTVQARIPFDFNMRN